jgi:hypothetical protein
MPSSVTRGSSLRRREFRNTVVLVRMLAVYLSFCLVKWIDVSECLLNIAVCLPERCPSGDDPFTTVDETNCQGLSQVPGTLRCCAVHQAGFCVVEGFTATFTTNCVVCRACMGVGHCSDERQRFLSVVLQATLRGATLVTNAMSSVRGEARVTTNPVRASASRAAGARPVRTSPTPGGTRGKRAPTPTRSGCRVAIHRLLWKEIKKKESCDDSCECRTALLFPNCNVEVSNEVPASHASCSDYTLRCRRIFQPKPLKTIYHQSSNREETTVAKSNQLHHDQEPCKGLRIKRTQVSPCWSGSGPFPAGLRHRSERIRI